MTKHRIAIIGGDGIGPEVTTEAVKVVRAAGVGIDAVGGALDDLAVVEDGFELADAALHVALLVLGRLVVAVFRQIAQLAGAFDRLRDLDPAARGEVLVLGLEPLMSAPGELMDIGHGEPGYPRG